MISWIQNNSLNPRIQLFWMSVWKIFSQRRILVFENQKYFTTWTVNALRGRGGERKYFGPRTRFDFLLRSFAGRFAGHWRTQHTHTHTHMHTHGDTHDSRSRVDDQVRGGSRIFSDWEGHGVFPSLANVNRPAGPPSYPFLPFYAFSPLIFHPEVACLLARSLGGCLLTVAVLKVLEPLRNPWIVTDQRSWSVIYCSFRMDLTLRHRGWLATKSVHCRSSNQIWWNDGFHILLFALFFNVYDFYWTWNTIVGQLQF